MQQGKQITRQGLIDVLPKSFNYTGAGVHSATWRLDINRLEADLRKNRAYKVSWPGQEDFQLRNTWLAFYGQIKDRSEFMQSHYYRMHIVNEVSKKFMDANGEYKGLFKESSWAAFHELLLEGLEDTAPTKFIETIAEWFGEGRVKEALEWKFPFYAVKQKADKLYADFNKAKSKYLKAVEALCKKGKDKEYLTDTKYRLFKSKNIHVPKAEFFIFKNMVNAHCFVWEDVLEVTASLEKYEAGDFFSSWDALLNSESGESNRTVHSDINSICSDRVKEVQKPRRVHNFTVTAEGCELTAIAEAPTQRVEELQPASTSVESEIGAPSDDSDSESESGSESEEESSSDKGGNALGRRLAYAEAEYL